VTSSSSAGIPSSLAVIKAAGFPSSTIIDPVAGVVRPGVAFPPAFFPADFPDPPTPVHSACAPAGPAEPFFSSPRKVLAKSLSPCLADWRERTAPAGARDDAASDWMRLVSTSCVSGSAIPLSAGAAPTAHPFPSSCAGNQ
jgi:hypothetical protein